MFNIIMSILKKNNYNNDIPIIRVRKSKRLDRYQYNFIKHESLLLEDFKCLHIFYTRIIILLDLRISIN